MRRPSNARLNGERAGEPAPSRLLQEHMVIPDIGSYQNSVFVASEAIAEMLDFYDHGPSPLGGCVVVRRIESTTAIYGFALEIEKFGRHLCPSQPPRIRPRAKPITLPLDNGRAWLRPSDQRHRCRE